MTYFILVLFYGQKMTVHGAAKNVDIDLYARRNVRVQVLRDEETCCGKNFAVDTQKGEVFSCGSSAFYKNVHFFEG